MKIVIDIPEEVYKACIPYKDTPIISSLANYNSEMTYAIANGTPLPKGHGDLIDRNECLKLKMTDLYDKDGVIMYAVPTGNILRMKHIIEADKESEEE